MNRREFLWKTTGLCLGGAAGAAFATEPTQAYPFRTLEDALASVGFDGARADSFTSVWTADTHYGTGDPERILPPIFTEVLAMRPLPAFFAVAGDLICKASLSFGQVPDESQAAEAIAEFEMFKRHVASIERHVPVKLALGNHDTHAKEDAPALFHTVFPERPEYHGFEVKGVPFLFLNGGSCGRLDEEQRAWFCNEVKRRHKPGGTLIAVCHQPSLSSVTAERGVPAAIREALAEAEGDLWLIGGHAHCNHDHCHRLPKGVITQAIITTASPNTWGSERPGYWVYAFSGGRLVARVYRHLGHGYRVATRPSPQSATPIRLPFEGRDDLVWHILVGEGDEAYLVDAKAARCQNYWHYTQSLTYRFPLELGRGKARRVAVLETPVGDEPRKYFVSADGVRWDEVNEPEQQWAFTRFSIPAHALDAGVVFVKVEQCVVSGFALTT